MSKSKRDNNQDRLDGQGSQGSQGGQGGQGGQGQGQCQGEGEGGMGFDVQDDAEEDTPVVLAPVETPAAPRQDNRPPCPKHGVQMVSYSTSAMYTYYRCPLPNCHETTKRIRPIGPLKNLYGHGKSKKA